MRSKMLGLQDNDSLNCNHPIRCWFYLNIERNKREQPNSQQTLNDFAQERAIRPDWLASCLNRVPLCRK